MNHLRSFLSFSVSVFVAVLAGCAGNVGSSSIATSASHVGQPALRRAVPATTLYVASYTGVAAFDVNTYQLERTYGASQGLVDPVALSQDASGDLFVANPKDGNVIEFAAGTTTTIQTLTAGVHNPRALAFDPSGDLYVINGQITQKRADITVYSPSGTLLRTIKSGINEPSTLAFDSAGNLYVGNQGTRTVTVYAGGGTKLSHTIAAIFPNYLLLDGSNDIYVAGCGKKCKDGIVNEYSPLGKSVIRSIRTLIKDPRQLALDSNGNLLVAAAVATFTRDDCHVNVYAPGAVKPFKMITEGVHESTGIALDASENVYVMNSGRDCGGSSNGDVVVYPDESTSFDHKFHKPMIDPTALIIGG
jgi:hypothetical protein